MQHLLHLVVRIWSVVLFVDIRTARVLPISWSNFGKCRRLMVDLYCIRILYATLTFKIFGKSMFQDSEISCVPQRHIPRKPYLLHSLGHSQNPIRLISSSHNEAFPRVFHCPICRIRWWSSTQKVRCLPQISFRNATFAPEGCGAKYSQPEWESWKLKQYYRRGFFMPSLLSPSHVCSQFFYLSLREHRQSRIYSRISLAFEWSYFGHI